MIGKIIGWILEIILIIFLFVLVLLMGSSLHYFEADNIAYAGNEKNGYSIIGISEKGKTEDYIIVPSVFNDRNLKLNSSPAFSISEEFVISNSIKRIYFESKYYELDGEVYLENGKVIMLNTETEKLIKSNNYIYESGTYICSKSYYEYIKEERIDINENEFIIFDDNKGFKPANLSYNYNYENAPNNGYYFIDDYDDELISYIPKNPERNGYIFMGWYKEAECINKWDFKKDKVPGKEFLRILDDNEVYKYEEIKLYAKWE